MKVLFVGGNGNISWNCSLKAAEEGHEVYVLNRGLTSPSRKQLPGSITALKADARNPGSIKSAVAGHQFDAVVDFTCYNRDHALAAIEIFSGIAGQYVFISSTANYQHNPSKLPFTETSPQSSFWQYAKNKSACEEEFLRAHKSHNFPITIVRPAHTYDTIIPDAVGNGDWTITARILAGKPIVLHGDGTSLWTLTHARDFAAALIRLLNNKRAIGEAYHITSDEIMTWREIVIKEALALGVRQVSAVFVPSSEIMRRDPALGSGLLGHKAWCDIYDNSKIKAAAEGWKAAVPFEQGISETYAWYREDQSRQIINQKLDSFMDGLISEFACVSRPEQLI